MMRSFIASIILFFSLIGVFAPVGISVTSEMIFQSQSSLNTHTGSITVPKITLELNQINAQVPDDNSSYAGTCGWKDFACAITNVIVNILLFVPNMIAMVAGVLADFLLSISINPGTYGVPGDAIETNIQALWKITRDLANIGFIFALFVSAFALITGSDFKMGGDFSPKKTILRVVIMALLVNFSMFFCRVIIQTADVFSHVIANQIAVGNMGNLQTGEGTENDDGVIVGALKKNGINPVSLKILEQVQPQKLFSGVSGEVGNGANAAKLATAGVIFFVLLALISVFVHMAFIFLGRIVGLWLGIILSPIAFVSFAIPFLEKNPYIGFENWLKGFTKLAFLTPLYLFFVYIAISLLDANFVGTFADSLKDGNWAVKFLGLVIGTMLPLSIALFVIFQGKKYATEMAGVIGELVGKVTGVVSAVAVGAATGGTGLLARQTLGRAGAAIGNSESLTNAAAAGGAKGWAARNLMKAGDKTSAMSFDVRNSPRAMDLFGRATGALGGGKIDMGKNFQNKGGFETEGGIEKMPGKYANFVATNAEAREKANTDYVQGKLKKQEEERQKKVRGKLADNQADIEAEKKKLEIGAENATVGGGLTAADAQQAQLTMAGNNQVIADIDSKLKGKKNDTDSVDTEISNIDAEIQKQDDIIKNSQNDPMGAFKRDQANQEKQKLMGQKTLALQKKQQIESESADLEKEKADLEKENQELLKDVKLLQLGIAGKSVAEVRNDLAILQMEANTSNEKEGLDKLKTEMSEEQKKLKEFTDQLNVAKKSNNAVEEARLNGLITKQKDKFNQVTAKHKSAKDAYDQAFGKSIKALEDAIKDTTKKHTEANKAQLDSLQKVSVQLQKELMQTEFEGSQRMNRVMETMAQVNEGKVDRGGVTRTMSGTLGVITGGMLTGGSNFNRNRPANRNADHARSFIRTGKK